MINRILEAQLCTYTQLKSMTIDDIFEMLLIVEWRDHVRALVDQRRSEYGCR